ncbi:MAG: energy transducer TonB [Proteobacteria bacterium]|nr:energy transducer TonB [Pseudomonadota bacterium]
MSAAPPPVEEPPSTVAKAPQIGISPTARRARTTWYRAIAMHLERYKRYPAAASAMRSTGTVQIAFVIDREGTVRGARIAQSSGSDILDAAALDLLSRAGKLPVAPSEISGSQFQLAVPIVFKLP